jgi:hypothetical protein
VRKLPAVLLAGAALAVLGGTAIAASQKYHVMTVPLPDGSTARVEYAGDLAPKVIVDPVQPFTFSGWAPMAAFAGFDRMISQLNRQAEEMMHQAEQMARRPAGNAASQYVASFGTAPEGVTSTTIVSYSNGNSTCTRTTETISQGPGKPAKVRSSVSGNCGAEAAPSAASAAPLNHT